MNQNYLKLQLDQPQTIALKYPTPREVSGTWGPQLLWILADGRAFYTTPEYRDQIARFKPGERFSVTKRKQGNKTVLEVSKPDGMRGCATVETTKDPGASRTAASHPVSGPQPAIRILSRCESLDSPVGEIPRTQLGAALQEAVSAADQAEKHAQKIGYTVRFSPADIRAMAISVLISMQGRRAA